jgi:hypothetical protein
MVRRLPPINFVRSPPTMAVKIPATGGTPDAPAIPRHSGRAIRKTRKPAMMSDLEGRDVYCCIDERRNPIKTSGVYIYQCMSV